MKLLTTSCIVLLVAACMLFDTGDCDRCHRKRGVCKPSIGVLATCLGVSRANECRYSHYSCCYAPMRGKRRRKRRSEKKKKELLV